MAYDDLKEHGGRTYSGMRVGGRHEWVYPRGIWRETKVAADRWEFTFESFKERMMPSPQGSGAPVDTEFHWYILGHQRVRKVDADTYSTFLEGLKYKVGHRRAHWRRWSTEYPGQATERERLIAIFEDALARLREGAPIVDGFPLVAREQTAASATRPDADHP